MTILHPHHTDPVLELYDQALAIERADPHFRRERIHFTSAKTSERIHTQLPEEVYGETPFKLMEDEQIDLFKLHGRRELLD